MEALKKLLCRVPWKAWLAVGGLLAGAFWMQQHDARIRRQARLQQLRNQTSAQVSALRRQAAQDVKQANVENKKVLQELVQRRQQAAEQNRQLAAQLARLRMQAQIQAGEVATLPISEIVTRVAAQLGLKPGDVAADGTADIAKNVTSAPATRNRRLCDLCGLQALTQRAQRSSVSSVLELFNPQSTQRSLEKETTQAGVGESETADIAKNATPAPAGAESAALALTSSGARKVETALVELDACRAENDIEARQISNCQARAEADEAALKRQAGSMASLNQALQAKDEILARQQSEYQAELRAARGTFLGRLAHAAEHVAIGVAVGVAIGVAVK